MHSSLYSKWTLTEVINKNYLNPTPPIASSNDHSQTFLNAKYMLQVKGIVMVKNFFFQHLHLRL